MVTNIMMTVLYPAWCYLFIVKLDLGVPGCALVESTSQFFTLASNLVYTRTLDELEDTHVAFSFDQAKTKEFID